MMSANKKQLWSFAVFFVLYELIIYLSNDMIMPAMLQVVADFHAADSDIALSLSLYILGGS
ncbi:MAG TPA: MFS transporter, partial [Burkholderiaceae bacterium]